jgi:hypothetical protein
VVSATLTRDPSKIERLGLHCPRYVAMSAGDHRRAGMLRNAFKIATQVAAVPSSVPAASLCITICGIMQQPTNQPAARAVAYALIAHMLKDMHVLS